MTHHPDMQNRHHALRHLVLGAVFAALIFVATAYLPRLPFAGGYVHPGDAFLYLAAALLPTPIACAAGAIGAGLADALTGYLIWMPGTVIIKALLALPFTARSEKILCRRNLIACAAACAISIGGYYLYEILLTRSLAAPAASVFFNLLQGVASAILFGLIGLLFDRTRLKKHLGLL